ncbi:MAG: AAA family ATPase [Lentisphaeria bacterium]|jgi:MoxR-like ATPase
MAATLEILSGTDAGKLFTLDGGSWLLGRGDDCDVRIQDASISRHHLTFTIGDPETVIADLDSHNGTFLGHGRERITSLAITAPTRLRVGTVELLFTPAPPAAGAAAKPPRLEPLPASPSPAPAASAGPTPAPTEAVKVMSEAYQKLEAAFGQVIVGQREVFEQLLIALAANGHCLMVGLPGLAKTLMVSTLAKLLQLAFKRIQFTPDLMPADIVGSEILEVNESSGQKSFRFVKGPIFTNMLLADEINRTPPKTQAALLESMQEHQVTVANNVFPLPRPFFVLATQNPLEQEGTYPLPEAQLDRFLFNILVDYPSEAEEERIVHATTGRRDLDPGQALTAAELLRLQTAVLELPVSPHVVKYATRLVRATRPALVGTPEFIRENVTCGAGPRAAQHLVLAAKAKAVVHGRLNVSCEDVRSLAHPVLRHRIFTNFTADSEGITPDKLIERLLREIPEPGPADYKA